jgi:hypothetical protein
MSTQAQLLEVAALTSKKRVCDSSRDGYSYKIKYVIKFMEEHYPQFVEVDAHGKVKLKLPLSFVSLQALFAKLQVDEDLPRHAKKRNLEERQRRL